MEAQSMICGPSPTPQPNQTFKTPFLHKIPTSFSSSFSSNTQHPKRVSFNKLHFSLASSCVLLTKKRSKFIVCAETIEGTSDNTARCNGIANIRKKNLAVFVSGGGSNFKSVHQATLDGSVHGNVVVLVTNKPDCGGAVYARDNGIPVIMFPKLKDASESLSAEDLVAALRIFQVDFILLAGYLKLIPAELIQAYPRSVFNIHPSLLPAFGGKGYYGMKVHKAVIASGARYSGPTIHHVDEKYDTGRILAQKIVPVLANDTAEELAVRVLHKEHKLYVEVASALCEERIIWREDGVPLIQSKENPDEYR